MFQKIVIASHNAGKVREIGELIAPLGIKVVCAADVGVDEPEETGLSFAENAAIKARNAALKTGIPALADDSGLVIPALGGDPGIYSARWAVGKDFAPAFARIERELSLKNIVANGTPAYFICALCLAYPSNLATGEEQVFDGRIDGTLTFPAHGGQGFGYDPIFTPDGYDITFAQMEAAEKHKISHRAKAFEKFLAGISSIK